MRGKFLLTLFSTGAMAITVAVMPLTAVAQKTDKTSPVILKSKSGVTTRGAQDPNIKQGIRLNDPNSPAQVVTKNDAVPAGAKSLQLKSQQGVAGSVTDPNIKKDEMVNDKNKPRPTAPRSKGGTTRGGAGCEVRLDNSTGWNIKVYVDGIYRGAMGAYDDATVNVGAGQTKVYARADFTDGSFKYWGPQDYSCQENQYINFKMVN